MAQRIKGQEVEIVVLDNGEPVQNLTTARSLEVAWKTEQLQEGYLGETTDRYDTIYKGIRGRVEFHFSGPQIFDLIKSIVDKARRRTPGQKINIKATLNFPDGSRARIVIPDAEFGEMPVSFGDRTSYGTFSLDFGASDARSLTVVAS